MKKEKKPSDFSRLMGYAGKRKMLTYLSLVLSAVSSVLSLFPFLFIYRIVREVIKTNGDFTKAVNVVPNGWYAVLFAALSMIIYVLALMCSHLAAFRVAGNIKTHLLRHILSLPASAVESFGSGRIRKIINDSSSATENYLAHMLPDLVNGYAIPVLMLIMLFVFDWRFGLASIVPIILSFAVMSKMLGPKMVEDMKQYQNALEDMNNEAVEYVRGIPVVKTFGQTVHSFSRFKTSITKYYDFCISYTKSMRAPMVLFTMLINSVFAFISSLALILFAHAQTADVVLGFIFYVIMTPVITTSFTKIMFSSETQMRLSDAFKRFDSIFELAPMTYTEKASPGGNSVDIENVTYRYPGSDSDAVKDINIHIQSGEKIALVGPSGGGKTTLAALVSRMYDVTQGKIMIGGVDVRDIGREELMSSVSYVFQDSRLLKMSIKENVRLADETATDDEIRNALYAAQCGDILKKLPNGMDTVIGTKGVYLSGGEMQRIAIARAVLKNSPVVILDEATAFADPENEFLVQKAFNELSKNKTVIMIAHRLSSVTGADCIYVMNEGRIVQQGKHDDLVNEDGLYRDMWTEYQKSVSWKVGA